MTTLVKRSQWGARAAKQGTTSIVERPSVTFHYVGGGWEFPWDHSSCDDKVREIQAWHMNPEPNGRGWSDIAYNYLVCPHDVVYEGRGFSRRSSANGTDSANYLSFAICALWGENSADDPLPDGLKRAFLFARKILMVSGGATAVVRGHQQWKSTECPGDQIMAWIKAGLPVANKTSTGIEDAAMLSKEAQNEVREIIREELKLAATNGQPLHEMVQAYSAFNARHSDQIIDDTGKYTAGAVDTVLKDDFQKIIDNQNQILELLQAQQ